jgi:hypothetical protein
MMELVPLGEGSRPRSVVGETDVPVPLALGERLPSGESPKRRFAPSGISLVPAININILC